MWRCALCNTEYADQISRCPLDGAEPAGAPRSDPLLDQVIKGRYRITDRVGEGGMGAVYRARQLSVGRTVVLKVLHREFARDEDFVQRFHQEARLAAGLSDPRLTTVFDFDQTDDGALFIVMEYLVGSLLSEVIRRDAPLPVARAVLLSIEIAEAVGAAHRGGVIHRDIKPQNIMVLAPDDRVKLMDFGIARSSEGGNGQLTRAGMMVGSPRYMAPEQIEGRAISEKTDIYALGVVFYEMLAGQAPFTAPTSAAVLTRQLTEVPRPLRSLRADVPPLLEQIVMQALEKAPESRQHSVADIVRRLRSVADAVHPTRAVTVVAGAPPDAGSETMAAPVMIGAPVRPEHGTRKATAAAVFEPPPPKEGSRWAGLRERRVAVIAVSVMVLVIAAAGILWSVGRPGVQAPKVAVTPPDVKPGAVVTPPPAASAYPLQIIEPPKTADVPLPPPANPPPAAKPPAQIARPKPSPVTAPSPPRPVPGNAPKSAQEATLPAAVAKAPSFEASRSPAALRAAVERQLQAVRLLRSSESDGLGVKVEEVDADGMVRLAGVVRDERAKQEARRLAQTVTGVTGVDTRRVNVQSSWTPAQAPGAQR